MSTNRKLLARLLQYFKYGQSCYIICLTLNVSLFLYFSNLNSIQHSHFQYNLCLYSKSKISSVTT